MAVHFELISALIVFAIATLFTPGPNNVMLMTSGVNFGFRRTWPHTLGVTLGFSLMVLVVGLGLGAVFSTYPTLYAIVKYAGAAYLLYLAWLIATSDKVKESGEKRGRPLTFLEAAAFQWINPKGWVMVVGAVTTYAAITDFPFNMIAMAIVFGLFGLASSVTWVLFGTGLRQFLTNPRAVRIFNIVMAILLVASLIPVFLNLESRLP
jgi:threonine/homoserine/homoserine lactone efflux protein